MRGRVDASIFTWIIDVVDRLESSTWVPASVCLLALFVPPVIEVSQRITSVALKFWESCQLGEVHLHAVLSTVVHDLASCKKWDGCIDLVVMSYVAPSGTTYLPLDFIFMAVGEPDYITTTKCLVYLFYQIPPYIIIECASKISSYSGVNLNRYDKY